MRKFPSVSGSNLLKEERVLPDDLDGDLNILVVAFKQWQQALVDSWVPTLEQLATTYPSLEYYELPTIRRMNFIAQRLIDGGMRAGIPSKITRRRTITLYIDKEDFKRSLSIDIEDTIYIYLVRSDGEILLATSGPYSLEGEKELTNAVEDFFSRK